MTVYLIDNHPIMSDQIGMLIRRIRPGMKVVNVRKLTQLSDAIDGGGTAELICMELKLPDTVGAAAVKFVRSSYPGIPLAVIASLDAKTYEAASIKAGATIFIEKKTPVPQVISTLRVLLQGEVGDDGTGAPARKLTTREQQLILLMDRGLINREMAEKLGISEHTVKVLITRFFRKIGVNSRTQAVLFCRTNGWLPI